MSVEPAQITAGRPNWAIAKDLVTTASSESRAFKEQIGQQLAGLAELPAGGVRLEIGYVVGPRRYWPNLWKPTIDALESILGRTRPDRHWHPRDGRIVMLGLHRTIDPDLAHSVRIAIRAAPAAE